MQLDFNNLRLAIQAGFNLCALSINEIVIETNAGGFTSEDQIDDLRDNMNTLRNNIATLVCCYGDSENIQDISTQCNLTDIDF